MTDLKKTSPNPSRSTPLEDYALLSDLHTGPLVSRKGSIDWLCLPRFDSDAIFTAILGGPDDGRWKLSIVGGEVTSRQYRGNTFILETEWRGPKGAARVTDFMPPGNKQANIIRHVECLEGEVEVEHDLRLRFSYARIEKDLVDEHGLVYRYRTEAGLDGLEGDEYPFLICAFWLVEQYAVSGRLQDAKRDMDRLCGYANDVGLLAEEYDPKTGRLAGNFPQAFSHLALIRAADAIQMVEEMEEAVSRQHREFVDEG